MTALAVAQRFTWDNSSLNNASGFTVTCISAHCLPAMPICKQQELSHMATEAWELAGLRPLWHTCQEPHQAQHLQLLANEKVRTLLLFQLTRLSGSCS